MKSSVNLGPIRLNLSKSGLGASVGITGFRLGIRPDGRSYIHIGRHGFYYREELGRVFNAPEARPLPSDHTAPNTAQYSPSPWSNTANELSAEQKVFCESFVAISKQAESPDTPLPMNRYGWGTMIAGSGAAMAVLTGLTMMNTPYGWRRLVLGAILAYVATYLYYRNPERPTKDEAPGEDETKETPRLHFEFPSEAAHDAYSRKCKALQQLASLPWLEFMKSETRLASPGEWRRNSNAASTFTSTPIAASRWNPDDVECNLPIYQFEIPTGFSSTHWYFLPEFILVRTADSMEALLYSDLAVNARSVAVVMDRAPEGATVIEDTWTYTNKDGSPDLRFNSNHKKSVVDIGEIAFTYKEKSFTVLIADSILAKKIAGTFENARKGRKSFSAFDL
nr:DUF4236 domain-containing protein [Litorivivens lipolytica]